MHTFSLLPILLAPQAQEPAPPFLFNDMASNAGIDVVNRSGDPRRWYIPESNGCGAAWLDYDGDGDMDLFIANGAGMTYHDDGARLEVVHDASSRLYRNDGDWKFTDVTEEAGAGSNAWINAVTAADADGDGDTDLYLACFGEDVYLRNEGGRFVDATAESGLGNPLWGAGASFCDVDRDGDLDLFVSNYVVFDCDAPPNGGKRMEIDGVEVGLGPEGEAGEGINPGAPNLFFENVGKGRFREATQAAGFALEKPLCSYACVFADVDSDGWPDLLVANDLQPANLFHNRGDGTFEDQASERGFALDAEGKPTSAMGLCVADVDGDGDLDVLRTNFDFEPNSLHLNDGAGRFIERAGPAGLAGASVDRLGWGGGFFDADLDGDLDLFVANGHVYPQASEIGMNGWEQESQLFEGVPGGPTGMRWIDVTERVAGALAAPRSARGVAFGDADDDGDLDLVIVDIDRVPRLLRNDTPHRGHWLGVRLAGNAPNTAGLGARVAVEAGGRRWIQEVHTSDGLYSSHDPRLFFGLGPLAPAADTADRADAASLRATVRVSWPSGRTQTLTDIPLDRFLTVREPTE
ncbi:MAG TPA: CRTAC1 family protein [Planctomycetes bacterium]|nr:CRTAC1 family protein [Planctomycetota bacterium]